MAAIAGSWAAAVAGAGLGFCAAGIEGGLVEGLLPFEEPDAPGLPAALADRLAGHDGPVLLVGADVPGLDPGLAAAALADLGNGCALSFAPATDGRPFLLALRRPASELLAFAGGPARHRDEVFAAALALDGDIGLLRSERRLVTAADARAVALDPLVPRPLRALAQRPAA